MASAQLMAWPCMTHIFKSRSPQLNDPVFNVRQPKYDTVWQFYMSAKKYCINTCVLETCKYIYIYMYVHTHVTHIRIYIIYIYTVYKIILAWYWYIYSERVCVTLTQLLLWFNVGPRRDTQIFPTHKPNNPNCTWHRVAPFKFIWHCLLLRHDIHDDFYLKWFKNTYIYIYRCQITGV